MNSEDFPIIGIGASAGGIDAFHSFLEHMPADCGMAFVMILHLPAGRKSVLVDILSRWTTMPVVEAMHGTRLEPNHVYVPPPHSLVSLDVAYSESSCRRRSAIDYFDPSTDFSTPWAHPGENVPLALCCRAPGVMARWASKRSRNVAA